MTNAKHSQANSVMSTTAWGGALQLLHNCDLNGAEAWRRLSKRYSPSTPLRAAQIMIQVGSASKGKHIKDTPGNIDRWGAGVLTRDRNLKEKVETEVKPAVLTSLLPTGLQKALIQQTDLQGAQAHQRRNHFHYRGDVGHEVPRRHGRGLVDAAGLERAQPGEP